MTLPAMDMNPAVAETLTRPNASSSSSSTLDMDNMDRASTDTTFPHQPAMKGIIIRTKEGRSTSLQSRERTRTITTSGLGMDLDRDIEDTDRDRDRVMVVVVDTDINLGTEERKKDVNG